MYSTNLALTIIDLPHEDYSLLSDKDLAKMASSGDSAAFEQLYWKHHKRVFGICLKMTKSRTDAEDLTQEIFIKLFHKIGTFRGDSAFTTWLYRMSFNTVLMHFRKAKTIKEDTTEEGDLPEFVNLNNRKPGSNNEIDRLVLRNAIEQLPDGYREIFELHVIQGFEHEEISRIVGCAVGTSKSQLFKAKRKLRTILSENQTCEKIQLQPLIS
jgi:RNA polymerase sigma-70 factor, ECF subfamily